MPHVSTCLHILKSKLSVGKKFELKRKQIVPMKHFDPKFKNVVLFLGHLTLSETFSFLSPLLNLG